jgi:TolC family type I secretion outer membrane protein
MKAAVVFGLCLACQNGLWAGEFQQGFEAALRKDASFQAARAELASVEQNVPMARSGLLPNVSLSVSDTSVNGSRTVDNPLGQPITSALDYRAPVQSLSFRTPIFNREASQKLQAAQVQVSYANAVFATRTIDLLDRFAVAYFQSQLSEQAVLTAQVQLLAAQTLRDFARQQFQLGEGTRPDALDADVSLNKAQVQLLDAQAQRDVANLAWQQMTGLALKPMVTTDAALSPSLISELNAPIPPLADLLVQAEGSNTSISARKQALALAQTAVTRNAAGHFPRLDLVASVSASSNESISTLNQSFNQRSIGLQLNLPLYAGGYVSASVVQALADQDKAEADLLAEQQLVQRELTKYYLSVVTGRSKIPAYQNAVASAQVALHGAHQSLLTGSGTQADVAQNERKLSQARLELVQTVLAYLMDRLRLLVRSGAEPIKVVTLIEVVLQ